MKDIRSYKQSDENYFSTLKHLYKPPSVIYVRGEGEINFDRTVAVVGTRRPSTYGKRVASLLTRGLAEAGFDIVSGLAFGIDSIAHQATLKAGRRTIAVVPGGLDKITPSAHSKLAEDIVCSGGMLVSEQAPGEPPHLGLFVTRNRIIAALSRAVIVIEAAERSGSLSTARFALEIGREVLAVPGEIDSVYSSGTNQLIRNGATLIRGVDDVLEALGMNDLNAPPQLLLNLDTPEEQTLVTLLRERGNLDTNSISMLTKLPISRIMMTITMLELKGIVGSQGGEVYMR